jgi:hypothetical protein
MCFLCEIKEIRFGFHRIPAAAGRGIACHDGKGAPPCPSSIYPIGLQNANTLPAQKLIGIFVPLKRSKDFHYPPKYLPGYSPENTKMIPNLEMRNL